MNAKSSDPAAQGQGGAGRAWASARAVGGRVLTELWRIRVRLLLINVVIVLVPVVGMEWARAYEQEMLRALERDMRHQAELLRTVLEGHVGQDGLPRFDLVGPTLVPMARRTRARIRLLDRHGLLLYDSHRTGAPEGPEPSVSTLFGPDDPPARRHPPHRPSTDPGPLAGRAEVMAAGRGELATATRIHERIGRVFLFLAMPVMHERRVRGIVYVTRSTTPVLQALYRLRTSLYQVLAVALGITVLTSLFLAGTISRPLARLTRSARRIGAGDRSHSLQLHRRDEIGELARAFDALVSKLDARARDVAELAANISHELKTPLASIRGAAELLADGAAEDPAARERFLHNIQADVQRLDRLVSRILELSRIDAARELREELDLCDVVLAVADAFPDHPVEVTVEPDQLPCRGNPEHLASAITALLENAVRHSPEQAPVTLTARQAAPGRLTVTVTDRGPGISEANQARIFDRFFTTEAQSGGTGLGLSIARDVARNHGGDLTVTSVPGKGATFVMTLRG